MTVALRLAQPDDLERIVRLHVDVWRDTYRGIAPPAAFDLLDEDRRRSGWSKTLVANFGHSVILAEQNGCLHGFVAAGPASLSAFGSAGEIKHLYVAQDCQGKGIGRRMFDAACAALHDQGFQTVALAVVAENTPAHGFYQRLGGQEIGRFSDAGPVWKSDNVIYSWDLRPPNG